MANEHVDHAKRIAADGLSFSIIADSDRFPPLDILNEFYRTGRDDLPGELVLAWEPFTLTAAEYEALFAWWNETHQRARIDRLSVRGPDFSKWFSRAVRIARSRAR